MSASKLKLGAVALALALLGTGLVTHQSLTAQAPLAQPAAGAGQNPFGGLRPAPAGSIDQRLADLEGRLEAALRDVRAVRQELKQAGGADLTTFRLKRASAAEAVRVLREVFGGTGARFDADERTNAVLVAAGERELREVRKVIEALDAERK